MRDALETAIKSESTTLRAAFGQNGVAIPPSSGDLNDEDYRRRIASQVARATIRNDAVEIDLTDAGERAIGRASIVVPWRRRPSRPRREIIVPRDSNNGDRRPIQSETRATLLRAIANGRAWLDDIVIGRAADIETIAVREGRGKRSITMMISLAFLAPDIIEAAVNGRLKATLLAEPRATSAWFRSSRRCSAIASGGAPRLFPKTRCCSRLKRSSRGSRRGGGDGSQIRRRT